MLEIVNRTSFLTLFYISCFIGVVVFAYGTRFDEYTDQNWEVQFKTSQWNERLIAAFKTDQTSYDSMADSWFAAKANAQSPRDRCYDVGCSIALLGASLFLATHLWGIRRLRDLPSLTTPLTRKRFIIFTAATWISFVPAEWIFYAYTAYRGDYPLFGDIIAIPCFSVLILDVVGFPFIFSGALFFVKNDVLPVAIFSRAFVTTVSPSDLVMLPLIVLAFAVICIGMIEQPPILPSAVATLYLLLSGRAARLDYNTRSMPLSSIANTANTLS